MFDRTKHLLHIQIGHKPLDSVSVGTRYCRGCCRCYNHFSVISTNLCFMALSTAKFTIPRYYLYYTISTTKPTIIVGSDNHQTMSTAKSMKPRHLYYFRAKTMILVEINKNWTIFTAKSTWPSQDNNFHCRTNRTESPSGEMISRYCNHRIFQ